jgi:putative membrane protein
LSLAAAAPPVPRAQWAMIGGVALLVAAANIDQPFPHVAPLHHVPTVALLAAAPFLLRRRPLSTASVACIAAFLALHTIGGRYTYWAVPYDRWSEAVTGVPISELSGFGRNMYDRFVHFAYGLLLVRPLSEVIGRYAGAGPRAALWFALALLTASSALYEMFEWVLTLALAGPMAADYNGQQGDIWDSQKDMALALAGALIAAAILRLRASRPSSEAGSSGRAEAG